MNDPNPESCSVQKDLRNCRLCCNSQGNGDHVDGVNAPVDDKVTKYPKKDQTVDAAVESERSVHQRHPAKRRSGQCAGSEEDESAVSFWACPPQDRKPERNREGDNVEQGDD